MSSLKKPQFLYNPQHHVKIWFSNKPNIFMNDENQMRLIAMRDKNPTDTINLIYDSTLLDKQALEALNRFCMEYSIITVDANEFGSLLKTDREKTLYNYYKEEINNLKNGGNLGVASDIVRWLPPVYNLGTYTDFDVPVDTSNLLLLLVEAPLLLNIGSLRIRKKELILSNNDFIAVVDPLAATEEIVKIQDGLIRVLGAYTNDFIEKTEKELSDGSYINNYLLNFTRNRLEVAYISRSKFLVSPTRPISSRKLRSYINEIMTDEIKFLNFHKYSTDETHGAVIQRLRGDLKNQLGIIKWLFFRHEFNEISKMLAFPDEQFLPALMKKERSLYIKSIVVCTTGPIAIAKSLFNNYVFSTKSFFKIVEPFSFNTYGLQKAFMSKNSLRIHENILGMMYFLGATEGELNDSSWLDEGEKLQETRVESLHQRKKYIKSHLPFILAELKKDMEDHITRIVNDPNVFMTLMAQKRKKIKINALLDILACFKEKPEKVFDLLEFRNVIERIHSKEGYVFAGLFYSRTKELIQIIESYTQEAVLFGLAKKQKIIIR